MYEKTGHFKKWPSQNAFSTGGFADLSPCFSSSLGPNPAMPFFEPSAAICAAQSGKAATKVTPHPSAHGRHPLPTGEGKEYLSFSLGEKVAEGRGRMRGLVIHKMFAQKTSIYDLVIQRRIATRPSTRHAPGANAAALADQDGAVTRNGSVSRGRPSRRPGAYPPLFALQMALC